MESLITSFSILAAIFSSLFWAMVLFPDIIKHPSTKRYGFMLLICSVLVFSMIYAKTHNMLTVFADLFPLHVLFSLCMFPLAYLFVHTLTRQGVLFSYRYALHFILPFVFALFFGVAMWGSMDAESRVAFITYPLSQSGITTIPYSLVSWMHRLGIVHYTLQIVIYSGLIWIDYKAHLKESQHLFSNTDKADLPWIKGLGILFFIVFVSHLSEQLSSKLFATENQYFTAFSCLSYAIFVFFTGLHVTSQQQLFYQHFEQFDLKTSNNNEKHARKKILPTAIEVYLKRHKPYLNPDYSLYDMCLYFEVNRTYLSNLINHHYHTNFRSLINRYRIDEAMQLIHDCKTAGKEYSLEYVAAKSGFNNYTTFSRAFKTEKGVSPKGYKETNIQEKPVI